MQLSENFYLYEFRISRDYPELAEFLEFTQADIDTLQLLADSCLQPIRDKFGSLRVVSGKRSKELNQRVGGVNYSEHIYSMAADFYSAKVKMETIYKWIKDPKHVIPYRKLIYYPKKNFIHISINIPGHEYIHDAFTKK